MLLLAFPEDNSMMRKVDTSLAQIVKNLLLSSQTSLSYLQMEAWEQGEGQKEVRVAVLCMDSTGSSPYCLEYGQARQTEPKATGRTSQGTGDSVEK